MSEKYAASAAANAFGTIGAICWSVQLLPQIWQNYRRQHTHGLQPTMMLLWASAGIPLGIYNIIRDFPVALWIQPQILTFLSLVTWAQTKYYPPGRDQNPRSISWCLIICGMVCALAGGLEVGIIFAIHTATDLRTSAEVEQYWPVVLMGVLSALLLAMGVGRHYIDIWKERTVRGISFLFVFIDALGDLTSLISVVCWWKAGRSLDILGLVVYGTELVLWMGVMSCGLCYNFPAWRKAHAARSQKGAARQQTEAGLTEAEMSQDSEQQQHSQRIGSLTCNVITRASSTSSSVFRTASGRAVLATAQDLGHERTAERHDSLRLRSLVQV